MVGERERDRNTIESHPIHSNEITRNPTTWTLYVYTSLRACIQIYNAIWCEIYAHTKFNLQIRSCDTCASQFKRKQPVTAGGKSQSHAVQCTRIKSLAILRRAYTYARSLTHTQFKGKSQRVQAHTPTRYPSSTTTIGHNASTFDNGELICIEIKVWIKLSRIILLYTCTPLYKMLWFLPLLSMLPSILVVSMGYTLWYFVWFATQPNSIQCVPSFRVDFSCNSKFQVTFEPKMENDQNSTGF